ncbi:glycosyltransferase family 2 protein [Tautonia sociabilis]|uniref:Glycosyltransferase n=1 Tax=Tautonia sociabilis TaxID=2080755 RepID=A0A432MES1_9BACT|nr:glycosyltransferase family 2 protein [Tautonia sociabilis]RUL84172.1 glycosyltransferase [Tautonia sociabilis]
MTPDPGAEWAPVLIVAGLAVAVLPGLPRQRSWARSLAVAFALAVAVRYLILRASITVLPVDPTTWAGIWVWTVFLFELAAIANCGVTYLMLTRTSDHSAEADRHERKLRRLPPHELPRVDVFLCTYNEGIEVLEGPILAAMGMDYPNFTLWVLDDGRRPWLRAFCEERGVGYITRPDNRHAKAGNINHALSQTDAELFVVLDADFAPRRDFLMRTVGFFDDPRVAIVQTPHHFLNADIFEMNLGLGDQSPNEQRLFFDVVQPSRDAWDCAFCCGSASVQRRSALMEVGGIPTDSVTEDILSSLALLRRGYVTRYLNEPLAFGLSPESVAGMFVQRQRWCRGGLQLMFLKDGPLGSGLSPIQRLFFFPIDWMVQTPVRLFAVLVPIVFLWTGMAPLVGATLPDLIRYQLPVLVALTAPMIWLSGGRYLPLLSTGFSLLLSFRLVPTILSTLIKPFGEPFRVTPKGSGAGQGVDTFARGCALGLLLLTMLGLLVNAWPETQIIAAPEHRAAASFFAAANAGALVLAILAGRDRGRRREAERYRTATPVMCEGDDGTWRLAPLLDVSASGAGIAWPADRDAPSAMRLHLPGGRSIRGEVVRRHGDLLGLRFTLADPRERDGLLQWIYSIGVDRQRAPLSLPLLARRLVARCLG